jgi:hypothetical protein
MLVGMFIYCMIYSMNISSLPPMKCWYVQEVVKETCRHVKGSYNKHFFYTLCRLRRMSFVMRSRG